MYINDINSYSSRLFLRSLIFFFIQKKKKKKIELILFFSGNRNCFWRKNDGDVETERIRA